VVTAVLALLALVTPAAAQATTNPFCVQVLESGASSVV
jgi:hypothetical protein